MDKLILILLLLTTPVLADTYQQVDDCPYPSKRTEILDDDGHPTYLITADERCQHVTSDGCIVALIDGEERVINWNDCPDKNLVQHLNCYDKHNLPDNEKPRECR